MDYTEMKSAVADAMREVDSERIAQLVPLKVKGISQMYSFWQLLRDTFIAAILLGASFVGGVVAYQNCPWVTENMTIYYDGCNCCDACPCETESCDCKH